MADWIRADDQSREWPEGSVIAFYPNAPEIGSGVAISAWRTPNGKTVPDQMEYSRVDPSHFFYLPPEPKRDDA